MVVLSTDTLTLRRLRNSAEADRHRKDGASERHSNRSLPELDRMIAGVRQQISAAASRHEKLTSRLSVCRDRRPNSAAPLVTSPPGAGAGVLSIDSGDVNREDSELSDIHSLPTFSVTDTPRAGHHGQVGFTSPADRDLSRPHREAKVDSSSVHNFRPLSASLRQRMTTYTPSTLEVDASTKAVRRIAESKTEQIVEDGRRTSSILIQALRKELDLDTYPATAPDRVINESMRSTCTRQISLDGSEAHKFARHNALLEYLAGTSRDRFALASHTLSAMPLAQREYYEAHRSQIRNGFYVGGIDFPGESPIAVTFAPHLPPRSNIDDGIYRYTCRTKAVLVGRLLQLHQEARSFLGHHCRGRDLQFPTSCTVDPKIVSLQEARHRERKRLASAQETKNDSADPLDGLFPHRHPLSSSLRRIIEEKMVHDVAPLRTHRHIKHHSDVLNVVWYDDCVVQPIFLAVYEDSCPSPGPGSSDHAATVSLSEWRRIPPVSFSPIEYTTRWSKPIVEIHEIMKHDRHVKKIFRFDQMLGSLCASSSITESSEGSEEGCEARAVPLKVLMDICNRGSVTIEVVDSTYDVNYRHSFSFGPKR